MDYNTRKSAMTEDELQSYWNTLCSFSGDDLESESKQLMDKIHYPDFLYKYRAVNYNNLDALSSNKMFFSRASNYDDPFDTFLYINTEDLVQEYNNCFSSKDNIIVISQTMKEIFKDSNLSEDYLKILTEPSLLEKHAKEGTLSNMFLSNLLNMRFKLQDKLLSICFSENGLNETLWLKYADRHRGFCLIYSKAEGYGIQCGKYDDCVNCAYRNKSLPLYPIYYSDTPYDASDAIKAVMQDEFSHKLGKDVSQYIPDTVSIKPWELERISLVKKFCHKYDEEWRILSNYTYAPPSIRMIPFGIIIGFRTSPEDRERIIYRARLAGIKRIYQSYIDAQNKLAMFPY